MTTCGRCWASSIADSVYPWRSGKRRIDLRFGYAQGFFCFTLLIGVHRVRDNVTPEPQLRYEAFANGQFLGLMDRGNQYSAWGNLKLRVEGPNRVHVEVVDAAGKPLS